MATATEKRPTGPPQSGMLAAMPSLVLLQIAERLEHYDRIAFSSTCRAFREGIEEVVKRERKEGEEDKKKKLVTDLRNQNLLKKAPCYTLDWFKWVHRSFDRRKGAAPMRRRSSSIYDSDLMELAAFQGSLETVEWLRAQGIELSIGNWACGCRAAAGGQIEALEWLRSEGYKFAGITASQAALAGNLDTLKWLRSQGCPFDEYTCRVAAWTGQLKVLQWLHSEGCPWIRKYCRLTAEKYGQSHVVQWIDDQASDVPK